MVSIDIQDNTFIDQYVFPKENQFVYFENLNYIHSILIDKRDLSFKILEQDQKEINKNLYYTYDCY